MALLWGFLGALLLALAGLWWAAQRVAAHRQNRRVARLVAGLMAASREKSLAPGPQ